MKLPKMNWDFDELLFIERVSRLLPWATPIYSAYLVILFLLDAGVFFLIALIEGLVVEGLGIVSVSTLIRMIDHNHARGEGDEAQPLPSWFAGVIALFYYVIVILVVIFLDVSKPEYRLINALLASLSLVSSALIGARALLLDRQKKLEVAAQNDDEARQAESDASARRAEQDEQEKRVKKAERLAVAAGADKRAIRLAQLAQVSGIDVSQLAQGESASSRTSASPAQAESASSGASANSAQEVASKNGKPKQVLTAESLHGTRLKIYELLSNEPNLTNKAVAESLGISHQAVSQYRRELASSGLVKLSQRSRK